MQLRPDIQISTMMTAMTDVIIPALDPGNRLAVEQAQLVAGMLHLMAQQMPLQFRFDRDELQRLVAAAGQILAQMPPEQGGMPAASRMAETLEEGLDVLAGSRAGGDEVLRAIRALRRDLGAVVTVFEETIADPAKLAELEKIILKMSYDQVLRDRALLAPQNWETNADALPKIEALLAAPQGDAEK